MAGKSRKRLSNEEIIATLLTEGTIRAASKKLGCKERTLYERMKTEDFKSMYSEAKSGLIRSATAKLQGQMNCAIDCLVSIMKDHEAPKQTRANCAVSILQYGSKFTETIDIMERLEAIEKGMNEDE